MSSQEIYYVVKKGHKPGIYKTWAECKIAVDGYKSPVFKKFTSFDEANTFYNKSSINNNEKIVIPAKEIERINATCANIKSSIFSNEINYEINKWTCIDNEIYIFTDGSSRKTTQLPNSGIGVYLGYNCINIKEQYENKTNNQCELTGLDYAFKLIVRYHKELIEIGKIIKIVSDSEYSIKACSIWLQTWKNNNWKTASGQDVKNRDIIESIDASMTRIKVININLQNDKKIKVKLIHVNSHQSPDYTDKSKFGIWFGNYVADKLSQNAL
jgi:ribonuclease HI